MVQYITNDTSFRTNLSEWFKGRLFYEIMPFDDIIKIVKNIKRIDIQKLDGITEWFDNLLHKYQYLTKFSDTRINRLCVILNRQVNKLKDIIEK